MFERALAWSTLTLALAGCGDATPIETATVRFDLADAPMAFGAVPFPSELYRDDDGRIALGALPNPLSDAPMFEATRELLGVRDGFCTSCNATFLIDGALAGDALPSSDALAGGPSWDDGVALVDVDPASPEHGRSIPLRLQWDGGRGRLSMRPARGETLRAATRYAAVVTSSLDGVEAAPAFARVRDGAPEGDLEARAADVFEPALLALADLGLARERVVGLAAFTTADPSRDVIAMRAAIDAVPQLTAQVDAVLEGAALDDLLGVPATPDPGIDLEPVAGSEGERAIAHATTALVVMGSFSAPRFVEGSGIEVGALRRDDAGLPLPGPSEPVPFVLIVPSGADLANLPVVVAHHGFNASRTTGFVLADSAGRAGFAVLAIDAYQHGERAASARDELHALRGDVAGADGLAETTQLDVSSRVFGLSGGGDGMALFPGYPQAAFAQFAADVMSAVKLVRDGDLDALRGAHPTLASLAFDRERIAFVGNSMGAVVGTAVLVAEPSIRAAVLDVMPGSISETLCESGEFRPLSDALLLPSVGVDEEFDEQTSAMVFDPTVDLIRWALEPVDPLALARYLAFERREAAGPVPELLIQLAGHDEVAAPTASESVVAAARIAGHGEFAFASIDPVDMPFRGEEATVAAVRFEGAMHGMLEVHVQASRYQAPLAPPPLARPAPLTIDNPIDAVHVQLEEFLASFISEGRATIIAP